MLSSKKAPTVENLQELQAKLSRQDAAISSYKTEVRKFASTRLERDLYSDLSVALAKSHSSEAMYDNLLEIFSRYFACTYKGVFSLSEDGSTFYYLIGKGYKSSVMSAIPVSGSIMGECLYDHSVTWIADMKSRPDHIPLNQDPKENNILCAPIVLFDRDEAVLRFANLDPNAVELATKVLTTVLPLVRSGIERLKLNELNEQTRRGLAATFAIAKSLENTLIEKDILRNLCTAVPNLFTCYGCIIAVVSVDGEVKPAFSFPEGFVLGGSPASNSIYLKNLLVAYPKGNALIKNVHGERRWAWPDMKAHSLCCAPLRVRGRVRGLVVAVGTPEEVYDAPHADLLGLAAAQTSLTLERAAYLRLQEDLARLDGLTGLLNHRVFQERIREEIERNQRYRRELSLVIFDIDHFKKFNDTYGHPVGDEVLKMVARTLKGLVRSTDMAFRYGGEEFTILLPETSRENAAQVAERLRQKIAANRAVKNLSVTISLGVTDYRSGETPETLIKRADTALYEAKDTGRNKVCLK